MPSEASVAEIWRYPVKSMGGERLERARIGIAGIVGDRGWAVRDEEAGEIRGAKKLPGLLACSARYLEEPAEGRIPAAEIRFPDGGTAVTDDPAAAKRLSELLGRRVSLSPLRPSSDLAYYRRAPFAGPLEDELRAQFGLEPSDPLPPVEELGDAFLEYATPPGTHFDAASIHLLTTAALASMAEAFPASDWSPRRFRPNFLVAVAGTARAEKAWLGRRISIGEASLLVEEETMRCVMTVLPQAGLGKDAGVMRGLVAASGGMLGVYAGVETTGFVKIGDKLSIS